MKPHISIIVARASNGVIGNQGQIPWRLAEDLQFFKQNTMGKPIIMGRKTWESIGRPLPGRRNIVLSRNTDFKPEGAEVFESLVSALSQFSSSDEVMIIGGGALYQEAIPLADTAWVTQIDEEFEGDAYFPELDSTEWMRVWVEEHAPSEQHSFNYRYQRFDRIRHSRMDLDGNA